MEDADKAKIKETLEAIRPQLQADGGDLELVSIEDDGTVKVKLKGACAGCPGAQMTLQFGVERILKEAVPSVTGVVAVQETGGANPQ